jgi:lipopolysaccharide/colanic/teichoic acid biosynthesis glycosyltransferase
MPAEIFQDRSAALPAVNQGLPRWFEAVLAFAALGLSTPLIGLAALAIFASSGGPVFFRQQRVGRRGRMFDLCKLRTMKPSSDGPQITSSTDARITALGRFLRHTKMDELPTFWNVVRGDMSLVGPRPEVPRFVNLQDPIWAKVLSVRPGITDPVTLRLRSEAELLAGVEGDPEQYYVKELQPSKLKGYVDYLEARTWRSDLRVLFGTVAAVVVPQTSTPLPASDADDHAAQQGVLTNDVRRVL